MRFFPSTYLLMFLYLETLTSIIRTGLCILMELIDLVNFCYSLTQMVNFPTQIPDCDSHIPALLHFFLSSHASICSTVAFPLLRNSVMLLPQFPLIFHQIHNRIPHFIPELMTILMVIGVVFVIISEMFHRRIL